MPLLSHIPHETFAQHYATYGNLRRAVADLGLRDTREAKILLHHPKVSARIEEIVGAHYRQARISATRTMEELARIAYFDPRELYDENGHLKPIHELDDDTAAAIATVKVEIESPRGGRGGKDGDEDHQPSITITKSIKPADKMAALNLLARHFKLVGDEGDGVNALANALADKLRAGRQRASVENAEDAVIHRAQAALPGPGARLEYGVPNEPSNGDDVGAPQLTRAVHDAQALQSPHTLVERVAAAPRPAPRAIAAPPPPARPAPASSDDELW